MEWRSNIIEPVIFIRSSVTLPQGPLIIILMLVPTKKKPPKEPPQQLELQDLQKKERRMSDPTRGARINRRRTYLEG